MVLQLVADDLTVSLGGVDTAIFAKAKRTRCIRNSLIFDFEDNWGTTGTSELKLTSSGNLQLTFSDLGTDGESYSRNVLGYYPEAPVVLGRMPAKKTPSR